MSKFPWSKPIVLRSSKEKHRQASWLELFVDLGFVIAIGSTSKIFEDSLSLNYLLVYCAIFLAIFWVWNRFTWYATHYDNDDVPFRLSCLAIIFCVIGMAASIEGVLLSDYFQFTLCYLVIEFILLYLWSRVWRFSPNKVQAKYFFVSYLIGTVLISVSLFIGNSNNLLLWIIATFIEAVGPIFAWYQTNGRIQVHTSHIIERHGLFTIILLGEGVVAISHNMSFPISFETLIPLVIAYGIIIALWWSYFDYGFGFSTNLSHNMINTFVFGYGQFFVFLALSISTVSLEYGLHSVFSLEHLESGSLNRINSMLVIGISGFLLTINAVQVIISPKNPKEIYLVRFAGGIAIGLCLFFFTDTAFEITMIIVLSILILVAVNDTYQSVKLEQNN